MIWSHGRSQATQADSACLANGPTPPSSRPCEARAGTIPNAGLPNGLARRRNGRGPRRQQELKAACPNGIDIYFENVSGAVWNAVLPLLNNFARVPVCGLVAHYNATALPEGPDRTAGLMRMILTRRLRVQGFNVYDFAKQTRDFLSEVGAWVREGKLKYKEDIVEGLENAPQAFIGLLRGANFGKLLVKVSD